MAVDCNELLTFAKSLPKTDEMHNRCAAGKSYYYAYHKCISVYDPDNELTGDLGIHERLIQHLGLSGDRNEKSISYQLIQLRKLRVIADYKLEENFQERDRETAIIYAEKIVSRLP